MNKLNSDLKHTLIKGVDKIVLKSESAIDFLISLALNQSHVTFITFVSVTWQSDVVK